MWIVILVAWGICGLIGGSMYCDRKGLPMGYGETNVSLVLGPVMLLIALATEDETKGSR